jgi:Lar family restriction alleviation protein
MSDKPWSNDNSPCEVCGHPVSWHNRGLKCCPFCGGSPKQSGRKDNVGKYKSIIKCKNCTGRTIHENHMTAIRQWNKRTNTVME